MSQKDRELLAEAVLAAVEGEARIDDLGTIVIASRDGHVITIPYFGKCEDEPRKPSILVQIANGVVYAVLLLAATAALVAPLVAFQ